ncbi:hypothetical protein M0Q50_05400 [bacterium]|jgi:hypothetical protein|nr:hypothetical protein [bacterium]
MNENEINEYTISLRQRILRKLDDLRNKIETNEPCPEKEQDLDLWVEVDDGIETLLNNWYY